MHEFCFNLSDYEHGFSPKVPKRFLECAVSSRCSASGWVGGGFNLARGAPRGWHTNSSTGCQAYVPRNEREKIARMLALIAPDRFGRLQRAQLVQSQPPQDPANSGWGRARRWSSLEVRGVSLNPAKGRCPLKLGPTGSTEAISFRTGATTPPAW